MKFNLSGLYVITAKHLMPGDSLLNKVESSLKGGARVVQLRDKDSSKSEIIDQGKKLLELTKKYRVPLIINDSPEIAREIGADGVHIGMGDSDISFVREILGNDSIIGVSCYDDLNRGQMAEKMGADYVAFGTPYDTPTKPGRKPTSLETLIKASQLIKIPVFAIGGIFPHNAREILNTGVDGIAVITSVFGADDPEKVSFELSQLFKD